MRVRFDDFVFDRESGSLTRSGLDRPLSRRAFELLGMLLERRPRAATHEELRDTLWSTSTTTSAVSLTRLVTELRRVLGDDPQQPRYVSTVHGVGYAFCGPANDTQPLPVTPVLPECALVWDERTFPLTEAECLIGRTADCHVVVDSPAVSRRHACVRIGADGATVEDLGSRNGTLLRGQRITGRTPLNPGDVLGVGPAQLVYRGRSAS